MHAITTSTIPTYRQKLSQPHPCTLKPTTPHSHTAPSCISPCPSSQLYCLSNVIPQALNFDHEMFMYSTLIKWQVLKHLNIVKKKKHVRIHPPKSGALTSFVQTQMACEIMCACTWVHTTPRTIHAPIHHACTQHTTH